VAAYDFSENVTLLDELRVQRVLGAGASDVATVGDALTVDVLSLSTDAVTASDLFGRMTWFARVVSDVLAVEDAANEGDLVLVLQGADDAVDIGPISFASVDGAGPLSMSGGPDISTGPGPVVFVTRSGDFVAVTDQLVSSASITVVLTDNVEAIG
jgi:hypothetical protein